MGVKFNKNPGNKEEIHLKIMAVKRSIYALNTLTRLLNKCSKSVIAARETKILRQLEETLEKRREQRPNQELRELNHDSNIIDVIKAQRTRRKGHIRRMKVERTSKWVMESSFGSRSKGRPTARWRG